MILADYVTWPQEKWGMNLGYTSASIVDGACYEDHRENLESIGFDYSPQRIVH